MKGPRADGGPREMLTRGVAASWNAVEVEMTRVTNATEERERGGDGKCGPPGRFQERVTKAEEKRKRKSRGRALSCNQIVEHEPSRSVSWDRGLDVLGDFGVKAKYLMTLHHGLKILPHLRPIQVFIFHFGPLSDRLKAPGGPQTPAWLPVSRQPERV